MIAGVRQFKLINALGREYDMTRPDALLHAPEGLGWGTERTVNRLGMTYIGINEKEIHQSPSGEMVFRTYEEYGRFLSFCQQGGLVLCYKPLETWYYCECLINIQKSEIQWENNHLICPVQFTLLSYWYEKVVAQTAEPPEPAEPNYSTVTGDPAVFTARYSYPIKELTVAIQGTQDLNGYSKPWVGGAGKNLLNNGASSTTVNGITFTVNDDGAVKATGTATANAYLVLVNNMVLNGTYSIYTGLPTGNATYMRVLDRLNGYSIVMRTDRGNVPTATVNTNVQITIYVGSGQELGDEGVVFKPMLVSGSTVPTTYEPYENIAPITAYNSVTITQTGSQTNTYEVELTGAGQVYKGTLDVTTGELVVNTVLHTFTGAEAGWTASGTYAGSFFLSQPLGAGVYWNILGSLCDRAENINAVLNTTNYKFGMFAGNGGTYPNVLNFNIWIFESGTTLASFKSYLATEYANGTPLTASLELATPLTYTLTPTQLSNLIGENSIQADAGAVTVTYRTDARTEFKIYPYQYSYTYGDTAQNVFDISCDLPSYFKLTVFGEATNPSWRVVQNGSIVKSGKLNATIGSSQKLVINTDPKATEIALYTLSNTRINNLYGYSDFATERIFALPQGESQVQVLTEDEQPPKVMIEVLKHV